MSRLDPALNAVKIREAEQFVDEMRRLLAAG